MKEISSEDSGALRLEEQVPDVGAEIISSQPASTKSNDNKMERDGNRRRRPVPQSQAKRRMEAMVTTIDHKLAGAFITIVALYAVITIRTYMSLESQFSTDVQQVVIEKSLTEPIDKKFGISDIATLQHTFPVHASGDKEFINHPGIFLANPQEITKILEKHKEDLPSDGKMNVPKFWTPTVYGPGGVRAFLGNYGETLITPEQATQIGSVHPESGLKTVYISVASYRDPECQPTVEDMFLRAEYPERLRVAIVEQRVEGEDDDFVPLCGKPLKPCSEDPEQPMCKYAHLVDVFVVPAILSVGPVFARHLANRMYRGEYFAMQVDSHVRFIRHWDSDLISQWESAKNEMAVITTYLSDITNSIDPVTFENKHPNRPIMCKTDYEGNGKLKHLRHGQQPEGRPGIHNEPTLHPFWAAGFSFARGHFVVQVPYDQYEPMVFQGEEIFMGLRGWTYGYDYYTAEISVAFHMYAIKENKSKRKKVKLFWENSNLYPGAAVQGMKRLNGIIGTGDPGDVFYSAEEHEYGLGKVRSKEQFYKLYGIHTETKTVEDNLCSFVGKPMMAMFKPHLRKNRMGIDFSKIDFEYKDEQPRKKKQKIGGHSLPKLKQ
jgi:[Skp1-protein]-hydroxyproline N-acetylglucosaminyltransferase